MTARRGTKNPALLLEVKREETVGTVLVTGRPMRVGENLLPIGVEVPGAQDWPRLDAWISARHIKRINADDEHVKHDDYLAWTQSEDELSLEDFLAQLEVERIEAEVPEEPQQPEE